MGDYTAKAQQMLRGRTPETSAPAAHVKETDFPAAPTEGFKSEQPEEKPVSAVKAEEEPLLS
jgi:hypothetical protein